MDETPDFGGSDTRQDWLLLRDRQGRVSEVRTSRRKWDATRERYPDCTEWAPERELMLPEDAPQMITDYQRRENEDFSYMERWPLEQLQEEYRRTSRAWCKLKETTLYWETALHDRNAQIEQLSTRLRDAESRLRRIAEIIDEYPECEIRLDLRADLQSVLMRNSDEK